MSEFESTIVAECPFSIAADYVTSYMQQFADNVDEIALIRLPWRTFGLPLPGSLRHRVRITFADSVDGNERNRSHRGLTFHWATANPLLPDLHGDLRFRIAPDSPTQLVMTGAYSPPLGTVGRLLDRLLGERIALATGRALLERIAADMERQERAFRILHSAVEMFG